ncbi:MAG: NAD-dependent epimerase/dehydratase family protein [Deltaproteobacteria bacterium]|nr:NAD-dependent epimerase/dehydratase family protein [Deltaproteobacteria bacterium]
MKDVVVFGCGYVGRRLARRLISAGLDVAGTTTTESNLSALAAHGIPGLLVDRDDPETWKGALKDARLVVNLAPPGESLPTDLSEATAATEAAARAFASASRDAEAVVYGSTTGAFGQPEDPDAWIDETTPTDPERLGRRGALRLAYEDALRAAGLPLHVVRISAIYGPGRTLRSSIEREALLLFEGGPPTSRIHVDDLTRVLEAMLRPGAPPLVVACDEAPVPTLEVARYTCTLLGRPAPQAVPRADAERVLSSRALEMRLQGRRCRSLVRPGLIGALAFPTYREGVRASLEAEGVMIAGEGRDMAVA